MIGHYTRGSQYAIRALVFLARLPEGKTARQIDVAEATRVPLPYLSKLLAQLARSGLINARRGPWGGVRLARSPETITITDVMQVVDGVKPLEGCVLGYPECHEKTPCPLHAAWAPIREQIESAIYCRTLAELVVEGDIEHAGIVPLPLRARTGGRNS